MTDKTNNQRVSFCIGGVVQISPKAVEEYNAVLVPFGAEPIVQGGTARVTDVDEDLGWVAIAFITDSGSEVTAGFRAEHLLPVQDDAFADLVIC
jgi:hypothetical protein